MANFREGLSVLEYFISTHGARKGLADTALKTADSGYMTRKLVDVSQDVIVVEQDCGTLNGIEVHAIMQGDEELVPLAQRILGRTAVDDIRDPRTNEVIVAAGYEIDEKVVEKVRRAELESVKIRSVLTCESKRGICAKCYGRNLANGQPGGVGRGHRHHCGAVHRRTGYAADDADLPHRRYGQQHLQAAGNRGQARRRVEVRRTVRRSRAPTATTSC